MEVSRSSAQRIEQARTDARGAFVIASENPMHDTGGGQRSAQLARELLRRDFAVVFVARGEVTETVDLDLRTDHPRLVELSLDDAVHLVRSDGPSSLFDERSTLLSQVSVESWVPVVGAARAAGAVTVYDCVDRWEGEMGHGWYRRRSERDVARACDVATASAATLVEHIETLAEREVHLVPNAFDGTLFDPDRTWPRPTDLPDGARVVLFVGALWGGWLDWDLVAACARARPADAFVFVGDHRREGRGLPANCRFLGLKPQTELPPYLAHADVAILPWRVTETTQAMSPLTVYEHIGMGLPVVAPPTDPLAGLPGVVRVEGRDAFVEAVACTSREDLEEDARARMRAFAAANRWEPRVDRFLELVAEVRRPTGVAPVAAPWVRSRGGVAVVIPSYNHERYIGEAVDSVRTQSLRADELLVIDDGSSDASLEVLADHAFPAMRVLSHANRGAHATINRAIALAPGDWVAILNSDDAFEPERLEHAYGIARRDGAALVVGGVQLVDGDGVPLPEVHDTARWYERARAATARARTFAAGVRRENVAVTTSNFFLHKELWRRLGGFRAYRYVHDYDFLLRALELCADRVVYAPELVDVRYRVHGDNTIAENVDRALGERAEMLRGLMRPWRRIRTLLRRGRERRAIREAIRATPLPSPVSAPPPRVGAEGAKLHVGLATPSLTRGGLEEVVALLARGLPAAGVRTSVFCTAEGGATARRLKDVGVDVAVGDGTPASWRRWLEARSPDLVSTHFTGVDFVEVATEAETPVVETIHNCYAWLDAEGWAAERRKRALAAATIAVSATVARYYRDRTGGGGTLRDRSADGRAQTAGPVVHVVGNGVHPARVARVPRGRARLALGVESDDVLFVHHGRITRQKNLGGLLTAFADALRIVPTVRLLLVGPGEEGEVDALRRTHAALFRGGAVRWLPPVESVGTVLSAADAYVSNSFYEGWSVAASEALWVGLPVVLSDAGSAAELVGADGARGRLVPNPLGDPLAASPETVGAPPAEPVAANRRALSTAIAEVAHERDAWRAETAKIRAYARDALTPERVVDAYLRIFRETAGRSAPPTS